MVSILFTGVRGETAAIGSYTLDDMRRDIGRAHETMPEDEITIEDQVAEDDRVVTRWKYGWKHDRSVFGEEPSGRWITMEGVQIDRLEAGRIAERWEIKDHWGVATRLGGKVEFSQDPRP